MVSQRVISDRHQGILTTQKVCENSPNCLAKMDHMEMGSEENAEQEDSGSKDEQCELMEEETEEANANSDDEESEDEEDADEIEVKLLEASLAQDPYNYGSHTALITKLQKMGELERLRVARENMNSKYPLSPNLWLAWMQDEIKLATTPEQKADVVKLCERAVKDYLSVEVWLEYLQFSIGNMGTEVDASKSVRELFERALTSVGLHCIKGAIIWEAFREFEAVLHALINPDNQAERKEQLNRIGSLFRRQLACPLLDMEKTHEEFLAWRSSDGAESSIDDKIVTSGYERSLAQFNSRLPFEEKIISAQNESEQLDTYKAYLMYEKQHGDPGRVTVLYERAITDLSLEISLWIDYLTYLENNIKIESIMEQVYQRASRNIPWCSTVWQKWMRSCEKWGKTVLEVQALLENALTAGFASADDYRNLWMTYLEFLRRKVDPYSEDSEEEKKQIETVRNSFNRACEHLAKSFGLDGDPNCVILQFWARTEAILANNMEKTRTLWADILSQGHSTFASYWLEYISLERCYGDTKHLRKLYPKALASVKDWPESIANAWIDFERDEGTLEQMEFCESKTKEKLEKVAEERQKAQASTQHEVSPSQTKKTGKRKSESSGRWENLSVSPVKIGKADSRAKPKPKESRVNLEKKIGEDTTSQKPRGPPPPGFKPPEEKMEVEDEHDVDDKITVFISNLDYNATEEEVREVLEPAGPITVFRMIRDYKGRSKGYCYVQLRSAEAVEKALTLDRSPVNGRPMFISRCDPNKATRSSGFKYSCNLEKNKLFIKGLPVSTTKEELEAIFKAHGALKEVRLVTYRNGHSKGLAYVEYQDEAGAAKALLDADGMKIEDKVISVALSKPPERRRNPLADDVPHIQALGGSTVSGKSTSSAPRTILSMIPRNVKPVAANGSEASPGNNVSQKMSNQDFRKMFLNKK